MTKCEHLIKEMQDVTGLKISHIYYRPNLKNKLLCVVYHVLLKDHYTTKGKVFKEDIVIIEKVQRRIQII